MCAPTSDFVLLLLTNLPENSHSEQPAGPKGVWGPWAAGEGGDGGMKAGTMQAWGSAQRSSYAAHRAAACALPPPASPAGRCTDVSFFTPTPGGFFFSSSMLAFPSSFLARWAFALSSALTRPVKKEDFYSVLALIPSEQLAFSR